MATITNNLQLDQIRLKLYSDLNHSISVFRLAHKSSCPVTAEN
ncbi:MAG: hypothetical protein V4660_02800 [Pseudomonadota bacterium]